MKFISNSEAFAGMMIPAESVSQTKRFGYDAVAPDSRRPAIPSVLRSEDWELDPLRRRKAVAGSRDILRNFSLAKWAVNRHLDYVSRFTFKSSAGDLELDPKFAALLTPDESQRLNNQIEEIIWQWGQPGNFEVTGRFSLAKFLRMAEAARVVDGDIGILKLADGRVQAVEGDRIRDEYGIPKDNGIVHGVRINDWQEPLAYRIFRRTPQGQFVFEREVPAENMILHGYFETFDQVRGISPVLSAVNSFRDIYEGFDAALIKAKLSQMMGIKYTNNGAFELSAEQKAELTARRKQVLRDKSILMFDLLEGEDAEIMESSQPSNQFQDYMRLMIQVSIKALDLPYSMFDETKGTFYGNKAGLTMYIESCDSKRQDNIHLLNQLTRFRLAYEIMEGRLRLPGGMTVNDIYFTWMPNGLPWWDAEKESKGLFSSILYGFSSPEEVCSKLGKNFEETTRQTVRNFKFMRDEYAKAGIPWAMPSLGMPQTGGEFQTIEQNERKENESF
ncbi:MAG: phage portal protein [Planctomycetaceae bacterium]|nr:phage portal protein [Planctomycetaceae bacterium]